MQLIPRCERVGGGVEHGPGGRRQIALVDQPAVKFHAEGVVLRVVRKALTRDHRIGNDEVPLLIPLVGVPALEIDRACGGRRSRPDNSEGRCEHESVVEAATHEVVLILAEALGRNLRVRRWLSRTAPTHRKPKHIVPLQRIRGGVVHLVLEPTQSRAGPAQCWRETGAEIGKRRLTELDRGWACNRAGRDVHLKGSLRIGRVRRCQRNDTGVRLEHDGRLGTGDTSAPNQHGARSDCLARKLVHEGNLSIDCIRLPVPSGQCPLPHPGAVEFPPLRRRSSAGRALHS